MNLFIQKYAQLFSVSAEPDHCQAAQNPCDSHVVVEWCQQSCDVPLLEINVPDAYDFSWLLTFQFHAIKSQHHLVRSYISLCYRNVSPKDFLFVFCQGISKRVESRSERVGEKPLYKSVMPLQKIKVVTPKFVDFFNVITVRLGSSLISVELDIVHWYWLFLLEFFLFLLWNDFWIFWEVRVDILVFSCVFWLDKIS